MVGHTVRYGVQRGVGVLCSSQHVFFMSQGEGREPGFRFPEGLGAWFQVSGAPLLCPPKIGVTSPQGGGGMTTAVPVLRSFYRPLRPSGTLSLT